MAEHLGASSSNKYYNTIEVRCIYSGNSRKYTITSPVSNRIKEIYANKFMKEECQCKSCIERREHRAKVIDALRRNNATRELRLLGEQ